MSINYATDGNYTRRRYYSSTKVPRKKEPIKRMDAHEYEKIIHKLMEKIDTLEEILKSSGLDKIRIVTSHKLISSENDALKEELKLNEKINTELLSKNDFSSRKIENINKTLNDIRNSYQNKCDILLKEIKLKTNEINELKEKLKKREESILQLRMNFDLSNKQIEKSNNNIDLIQLTNKSQKEKIDFLEKELNNLYINKKSEGNLLIENKHLKEDNVKLLELLSITKEFGEFANLQLTLPGGIRYVTEMELPIGPRARKEAIKLKLKNINSWVPALAYEKILQFNLKYNFNMDESIINELLGQLNKVYREKEERNVAKIKVKYQKQILNLMDKYGIRSISAPYNIVEVEKVKKEVMKKNKIENVKNKLNKKIDDEGDEIINFAKTAASDFFSQQKKNYDSQISELKGKLLIKNNDDFQLTNMSKNDILSGASNDYSSSDFYIEKIVHEISSIISFFEDLVREYKNRVKECEINFDSDNFKAQKSGIKVMKTSVDWLINSMKEILEDSKNQYLTRRKNKK